MNPVQRAGVKMLDVKNLITNLNNLYDYGEVKYDNSLTYLMDLNLIKRIEDRYLITNRGHGIGGGTMSNVYVDRTKPSILYLNEYTIDSDRIDADFYHIDYISNERQLKQSGLEIKPLGKIISKMNSPIGWQGIPSAAYLPKGAGVPLIRVQNVNDLMLDRDTLIGVQEYIYQDQPAIQAEAEDIIITRVGTIGRVCRVPNDVSKLAMGQNLTRIKVDSSIITSEFLTIFMASEYCQLQMKRYAYGGVQPSLTNKNIKQLLVPIPSPEIQKYIGDKVRRAEELREEAKAAKKDYEYIIQDIYSDSNTIKFPKGFYTVQSHDFDDKHLRIDSNFYNPLYKNRKLDSYKNVKLSKLVDLKKNCKIQAEEEYAYFEIGDLSTSNILDGKERVKGSELPGRAKLKLEKDDIIVSLVQESIEVTSYVDKELKNTLTTNGCAVLIPRDKSLSGYLYAIISSKYFIAQKCRYISGTNIRSMSKDDLLDMIVPVVEDGILTKVNELVKKEFACLRESKKLIQEAKQDVEDLIEGNFDMSKLNNESSTESRC